jgi:hypothetical protein
MCIYKGYNKYHNNAQTWQKDNTSIHRKQTNKDKDGEKYSKNIITKTT